MALAIANDTTLDGLSDGQKSVIPHFKNPAMPSVAATADAAVKIASVRPGFAQTDVFLEMMGYDQADIRRIKAQEQRQRGLNTLMEIANESESEAV
jgi:predicted Zn-dependent protease